MIYKKKNRASEKGNIFFTLFGAVAIVGVLGAAIMATMRGPLKTMVNVNRHAQAEAQMQLSAKLALYEASEQASSGDCEATGDGYVEPVPWKAAAGAGPDGVAGSDGGGFIPDSFGVTKLDPWGTQYGYCVWDAGTGVDDAGCGGAGQLRLPGNGLDDRTYTVIAMISAGPDMTFQTGCLTHANADNNSDGDLADAGDDELVSKTAGSDDIIFEYTYDDARGVTGGLWSLKVGDAGTATINKEIEVSQEARFTGGIDMTTSTAALQLGAASMLLPDSGTLINCNLANLNLMRINKTTDPDTVEICDDASDTGAGAFSWQSVAAGASGVGLWKNDGPGSGTGEIYYTAGLVGIGTNDPDDALDVTGVIGVTDNIEMSNGKSVVWASGAAVTEAAGGLQLNANGGTGVELTLGATSATIIGDTKITGSTNGATAVDALTVEDSTGADILVVQNDGKVGVGTAAPDDALSVVGNIDTTTHYKIDDNIVLRTDGTSMADTILLGKDAGASVTGDDNTVLGTSSATTLTTGARNIIIGNAVDVPAAATNDYLNIGDVIHGDLANKRVGIGHADTQSIAGFDDALEVNGTVDATNDLNADDDVVAGDDVIATSQFMIGAIQFGPPTECDPDEKLEWDNTTGWACVNDLQGGSGGAGQTLEEVLQTGNDANGETAIDLGGVAIGSGTLSTGGSQDLELDVTGDIGATNYCDASGNNCFTAAGVGSAATPRISVLTAANAANTIGSGDHAQIWNWALTTAGKSAFTFGESGASANGVGAQSILKSSTLATSTAMPLWLENAGVALSLRVDDSSGDTSPFVIDDTGRVGISVAAPNYSLSLDGTAGARTIGMERHGSADTAGNALTLLSGGATSGATDKDGGTLSLSSGTATGNGMSSVEFKTVLPGQGAGTTDRTPTTSMIVASNALTIPSGPTAQQPGQAGMQASVEGMIRYDTTLDKYQAYQNSAWQDILTSGGGAGIVRLDNIDDAAANNTIANAAFNQVWNWQLTAAETGFVFGESVASAGGSNDQHILAAKTLAASTAMPLYIQNLGAGRSFQIDDVAADTTPFVIDDSGRVGIGAATPSYSLSLDGTAGARTIGMERHGTADTAGNALTILSGGATSGAADKDGGALNLSSGTATGDGGSEIIFKTVATGQGSGAADRAPAEMMRLTGSRLGIGDFSSDTIDSTVHIASGDLRLDGGAGNQAGCVRYNDTTDRMQFSHDCSTYTDMVGGITADQLDFIDFEDAMDLDASTSITADGTEVLSIVNTGTGDSFVVMDQAADGSPFTIQDDGDVSIGGDLTISGDDLFMATNTTGFILVADGTNFNPVAMSGDVTISNTGATTIGNDKITEPMLKSVNAVTDEYCLTAETTTGDFEWQPCLGGLSLYINDLLDAVTDYTVDHNMRLGSNTPMTAGAVNNTFVGDSAGTAGTTNDADSNTAVGYTSLGSLTTGSDNTAVGARSMGANDVGFENTAFGSRALGDNVSGDGNVAVGASALRSILTANGGDQNVAVGHSALYSNQNGGRSTAVGTSALYLLTTGGTENTVFGYQAGNSLTTGDRNVLIGYDVDTPTNSTDYFLNIGDTIFGDLANDRVRIGGSGAVGAGPFIAEPPATQTIAATNTITANACGTIKPIDSAGAVTTNTTDTFTAPAAAYNGCCMAVVNVGANPITLDANANFVTGTGSNITLSAGDGVRVCGTATAWYQDAATSSIASGAQYIDDLLDALYDTGADHNMRLGSNTAMTAGAAGNLFIGESAGTAGTTNAADNNMAIGYQSLDALTTGNANIAMGTRTLSALTDGFENIAIGYEANATGTSTESSVAVGYQAISVNSGVAIGRSASSSIGGVAIGRGAGRDTTGGDRNVAIGYYAFWSNNTPGDYNVAIGGGATSGALGSTYGDGNVGLGFQAGNDITSGNYNIMIGYDVDAPSATGNSQLNIGDSIFGDLANDRIRIGGSGTVTAGPFIANPPAAEAIAAAGTITANACGTIKQIMSGTVGVNDGDVTTDTTNTFTAPAAGNSGCCMDVINIETGTDDITLDVNGNFLTGTGANITLNAGKAVRVCSNGSDWYQDAPTSSLVATNMYIDDLQDAVTDYVTDHNMRIGSNTAMTAGAAGNLFIGESAGSAGTSNLADANIAIGYQSLDALTTGSNTVAIGYQTLSAQTSGNDNVAIGYQAMAFADASSNIAIGATALGATPGDRNIGIGSAAGAAMNNATAANNVLIGWQAGDAINSGAQNIAIGSSALGASTTVSGQVAIGHEALMTTVTATNNTAVGHQALRLNQSGGNGNTALGYAALDANTTGDQNIGIGQDALGNNTIASRNVAIGTGAMTTNVDGLDNVAIGDLALTGNDNGSRSVAIGSTALQALTTGGTQNIGVGYGAGNNITTGDQNIIIGYDVDAMSATGDSQLNIGGSIYGDLANDNIRIGGSGAVGAGPLLVQPPATEAIAAAGTITANACGSIKPIMVGTVGVNDGDITTNTTNTFTAPAAANAGCCMEIVNVETGTDDVTLDTNANFITGLGTNITIAAGDAVKVCSNGSAWYQGAAVSSLAATVSPETIPLTDLTDAVTDYVTDHNMRIGSNTAMTAGAVNNTFIGDSAGTAGTTNDADGNTAVGYSSLSSLTTGSSNTAYGDRSLSLNDAGWENTALGARALGDNVSGDGNTAVGASALRSPLTATGGDQNVAVGHSALYSNQNGGRSTAVGTSALQLLTTGGTENTAFGYQAGNSLTTGDRNVLIGYDVDTPANSTDYFLNIADTIFGDIANDRIRIGGSGAVSAGPFLVEPPATEVIAGAATITANACGTIKPISAGSSVTTNTTNTFTAPAAANAGCCMIVTNVDTADTITLDTNANFITGAGTDIAVGPGDGVQVCSNGTTWYQGNALSSLASSGSSIDGLSDAATDYVTGHNMWIGSGAGASISAGGLYNLLIGEGAGANITTGDDNTGIGAGSLNAVTTQIENTAVGSGALLVNEASFNTAIGAYAMIDNVTGSNSVAIGDVALADNVWGGNNVAVGAGAMWHNDGGSENVAIGSGAMRDSTSDDKSVLIGHAAGVTGAQSNATGLGYGALYQASGDNNIGIGYQAGNGITSGASNIVIGYDVDAMSATGNSQLNIGDTIFGDLANDRIRIGGSGAVSAGPFLVEPPATEVIAGAATITANACGTIKAISAASSVTTNTTNTFTAPAAANAGCCMIITNVDTADTITLDANANFITGVGSDIAVGPGDGVQVCSNGTTWYQGNALSSLASSGSSIDGLSDATYDTGTDHNMRLGSNTAMTAGAANNLFIGESAGTAGTTNAADGNIAIGYQALDALTTGASNVAIGVGALSANTTPSGQVAIGFEALMTANTATENTAIGYQALRTVTASQNVAVGHGALDQAGNAERNVAVGTNALTNNSTGGYNVAIGSNALLSNNDGGGNVAVGQAALYYNSSGAYNVAIGRDALGGNNSNGSGSTAVGYNALLGMATGGTQNTALGYQAGDNITTGDNNIMIGYDVDAASATANQQLNIGNAIYGTGIHGGTVKIGIANSAPETTLEVTGSVCVSDATGDTCTGAAAGAIMADGAVTANAFDVAERYASDTELKPGTIVALDGERHLYINEASAKGTAPVLGIVSTDPGLVLGWENNEAFKEAKHVVLVALAGRVPLQVTGENGSIKIGDRIALSATVPGYGAKASDKTGTLVGIALENFNATDKNARGTVNVFVDTKDVADIRELRSEISSLKNSNADLQKTLANVADDIKGLKAHTGYGTSKAEMTLAMLAAIALAGAAFAAGAALRRRRK